MIDVALLSGLQKRKQLARSNAFVDCTGTAPQGFAVQAAPPAGQEVLD
jgi:hypothetical protein